MSRRRRLWNLAISFLFALGLQPMSLVLAFRLAFGFPYLLRAAPDPFSIHGILLQ